MNALKTKWLIVSGIWIMALFFTFWNWNKINAIMLARENEGQMRKELSFQLQKTKALEKVYSAYESLYYRTPSTKLGVIAVEHQIRSTALASGLQMVELQTQTETTMNDQVILPLVIQGSFQQVFQFVSDMAQYGYLPVRSLHLKIFPSDFKTRGEMEFVFQYRIMPSAENDEPSRRLSDPYAPLEGSAL